MKLFHCFYMYDVFYFLMEIVSGFLWKLFQFLMETVSLNVVICVFQFLT